MLFLPHGQKKADEKWINIFFVILLILIGILGFYSGDSYFRLEKGQAEIKELVKQNAETMAVNLKVEAGE